MRLHWLSCMKQTLVMTDLQLCEHSVSSLREKKEPQNESSSSLSVSVNKAFWIFFAAFDSFPLCSDLFGDHEAVTYLFIYLFLAADPRPPRSLVRPLLCSPDAAS